MNVVDFIPELVCEEKSDIDETEGVWLGVPLKDSTLLVLVAENSVELFIGYDSELEPGLLNTEDDTLPETLESNGPALKGPVLGVVSR